MIKITEEYTKTEFGFSSGCHSCGHKAEGNLEITIQPHMDHNGKCYSTGNSVGLILCRSCRAELAQELIKSL